MKKYAIIIICGLILISGSVSCPIYAVFGIPCLSCGITRAYKLFFTGHFARAFAMHPLFLLPAVFIFEPFRKKWIAAAVIVVFAAVYIVRFCMLFPNTPPFNYNYDSLIGEFFK